MGVQVSPPLVLLKTSFSLSAATYTSAYTVVGVVGSTVRIGTVEALGSPVLAALQLAPPVVLLYTPCPIVPTYTVVGVAGLTAGSGSRNHRQAEVVRRTPTRAASSALEHPVVRCARIQGARRLRIDHQGENLTRQLSAWEAPGATPISALVHAAGIHPDIDGRRSRGVDGEGSSS